jgi:hypothetical protein
VHNVIPLTMRMKSLGRVAGMGSGMRMTKGGKQVRQRGRGFFFLPGAEGHKPGIFRRIGGELIMVRDLSRHSYVIHPRHFHTEAVRQFGTRANLERIFIAEAKKAIGKYQPR